MVGPTGETYLYEQEAFGRVFYDAIVSGKPIGDALLAAWQAAGGAHEDVVRSYLLLGDPALRIHLD